MAEFALGCKGSSFRSEGTVITADPSLQPGAVLVGKSQVYEYLHLPLANRHGLIAGATGTGKTVTLQKLAEGFSNAGVSVFMADVKGDLAGMAAAGDGRTVLTARAAQIGVPYEPDRFPVVFWDVFGLQVHALRATPAVRGRPHRGVRDPIRQCRDRDQPKLVLRLRRGTSTLRWGTAEPSAPIEQAVRVIRSTGLGI